MKYEIIIVTKSFSVFWLISFRTQIIYFFILIFFSTNVSSIIIKRLCFEEMKIRYVLRALYQWRFQKYVHILSILYININFGVNFQSEIKSESLNKKYRFKKIQNRFCFFDIKRIILTINKLNTAYLILLIWFSVKKKIKKTKYINN